MSSNMLHKTIDADKLDALASCKTSEECAIWLDMHYLATAKGICSILASIEQTWHRLFPKDKIIAYERQSLNMPITYGTCVSIPYFAYFGGEYRSDVCVKNIFKAICDAHVLDEEECKKLLRLANAKVKTHKDALKRLSKKLLQAKQSDVCSNIYVKSNAFKAWYEIWGELSDKAANILTKQQFDTIDAFQQTIL